MHLSHSLEVDIDKYHLIPVCLLIFGITVFEKKMQCLNTDNQIMMNEGNKCFPPSLITEWVLNAQKQNAQCNKAPNYKTSNV